MKRKEALLFSEGSVWLCVYVDQLGHASLVLQEAEEEEVAKTFKRRKTAERKESRAPLGVADGFKPLT